MGILYWELKKKPRHISEAFRMSRLRDIFIATKGKLQIIVMFNVVLFLSRMDETFFDLVLCVSSLINHA